LGLGLDFGESLYVFVDEDEDEAEDEGLDDLELLEESESDPLSLELEDELESDSLLTLDLFLFFVFLVINSVEGKGITVLGIAFKWSLKSSVRPPKPIDVKKLMANLVFLGSSRGKSPSKAS